MTDSDDRTLEELAAEVTKERERDGRSSLDVDDSAADDNETREDHLAGDAGPLQGEAEEVPMGSIRQAHRQDGPMR